MFNPILTGLVVEKTTSHICSEEELKSSASNKVNENGVKMSEAQSWEAYCMGPAYKTEERNETIQVCQTQYSLKRGKEATASDLLSIKRS